MDRTIGRLTLVGATVALTLVACGAQTPSNAPATISATHQATPTPSPVATAAPTAAATPVGAATGLTWSIRGALPAGWSLADGAFSRSENAYVEVRTRSERDGGRLRSAPRGRRRFIRNVHRRRAREPQGTHGDEARACHGGRSRRRLDRPVARARLDGDVRPAGRRVAGRAPRRGVRRPALLAVQRRGEGRGLPLPAPRRAGRSQRAGRRHRRPSRAVR